MSCERTENRFAVLEEVVIHSHCAAHDGRGLEQRVAYLETTHSKVKGVTDEPDRDSDRRFRDEMEAEIQRTKADLRKMKDDIDGFRKDLGVVGVQVEGLMRDLRASQPA